MAMHFLEQMDPSPLTFLCTIHHVTLSIISEQNDKQLIGEHYTIEVFVTTNESLLFQCFPISLSPTHSEQHHSLPEMTITIASQSKANLIQPHILTVPHADGGLWSLDCSATDPQEFHTLQDMMTYFIKFENQRQMRNTLAMVNPSSYQVTHVIAENVYLDRSNNNSEAGKGAMNQNVDNADDDDNIHSLLADDDFIATRENYYGQKLPVTMDDSVFKDGLELRKVRLMYQTSHCIDVGSDWLARGLVNAGDSIANYIHSGSRSVEGKTVHTELVLSSKERHYFDMVYNFTSMAGNMAGQWFSKLVNLAAVKQATSDFHLPTPQSHLGNSALQAATRVVESSVFAVGTVAAASRQGLIQVIEKKYGLDAGYMAEKILGSDKASEDVMVYFDGQGISRKVVVQQLHQPKQQQQQTTTNQQPSTSVLIYQDNENDTERELVYDIDELGYSTEEKKTGKFVMV